jgi:hypothetical protein
MNATRSSNQALKPHIHHNLSNNTRHDNLASSHSDSTKGGLRKRYVHYYTHSILKKF